MKNWKVGATGAVAIVAALLQFTAGLVLAVENGAMTPQLAAKKENFRKQQAQRITPEKRKAAAAALKAERLKIHVARQKAQQSTPATTDAR